MGGICRCISDEIVELTMRNHFNFTMVVEIKTDPVSVPHILTKFQEFLIV